MPESSAEIGCSRGDQPFADNDLDFFTKQGENPEKPYLGNSLFALRMTGYE